ncbi:hypothetical protein TARUN_3973 [Trichoderma arundinaceum]|uniref:Cell wall galactomanno n=1 Tax=Trichoderma arundinaceum TaxID=490622 RepID=A0A395NQH8_TRIAR|nr:hypothetical protein TARUN_3973 [Trichoderma arundinaceum]
MQFKCLAFLTAALSFAQAQAALSPIDVVEAIHNVTDISSDALATAKGINIQNALPSGLVGLDFTCGKIVDDFRQIVTNVAEDIKVLGVNSSNPNFPPDGQLSICGALSDFIKVHQDLLKTLIGQKGVLSATPLTAPIAAVLRILEAGVDKLANGVIGLIPTCAAKAGDELKQLDGTLDEAVKAFSVNVPGLPGMVGSPVSGPVGGQ